MKKQLNSLALIPARSGSKGLPGKNIRPLLGKPLINWTIESSLGSKLVSATVVSTDSEEIRTISIQAGAEVPFLRPDVLSSDTASSVDVALHALDFYQNSLEIEFQNLVLLEPTSPIRNNGDIDAVISLLQANQSELDAIVTIGSASHHPELLKKTDGKYLLPVSRSESNTARRQDLQEAFFPFGVAYAIKSSVLRESRTFYPERTGWLKIERDQEYEIDDLCDFVCVEAIMGMRGL